MSCLQTRGNSLYVENVSLSVIAQQYGTPCYIYSTAAITHNWREFDRAFQALPHRICYAVKANSNIAILNILARLHSSFDIVSAGELERVITAGGDPANVIFSGVGKQQYEIEHAIRAGIYCFNVESESEVERIADIAGRLNRVVNIALRINPNVDPRTHAHISTGLNENKFGIPLDAVLPLCRKLPSLKHVNLIGIACHIGSQIVELEPFIAMVDQLLAIYKELKAIPLNLQHINIGGGLGIVYKDENPPSIHEYARVLKHKLEGCPLQIVMEPGRAIVGNAGVLLTKVEYIKSSPHKKFVVVDAGMNDLLRPALYDAWQDILPVEPRAGEPTEQYDIAGPLCESADILGKNRELAVRPGDLLVVDSAGAYGFSMSSNYNSRCRAPELLVDGSTVHVIRKRETIADLFAQESLIQ